MTHGRSESTVEGEIASFVLDTPRGTIRSLGGLDAATLRAILDLIEPEPLGRRALALDLRCGPSAEALIDGVLEAFAAVALSLWPAGWGNASPWADAAARLARQGRPPRVKGAHRAIEIAELARIISPNGLVLIVDGDAAARGPHGDAWVRGLEWVAEHGGGAVVALFSELPPNAPPFDRILYDAMVFSRPPTHF